jgi:hypothetical protein
VARVFALHNEIRLEEGNAYRTINFHTAYGNMQHTRHIERWQSWCPLLQCSVKSTGQKSLTPSPPVGFPVVSERVVFATAGGSRERAPRCSVLPMFTVVSTAKRERKRSRGRGKCKGEDKTWRQRSTGEERFTDIISIHHIERRICSVSYRKIGKTEAAGNP